MWRAQRTLLTGLRGYWPLDGNFSDVVGGGDGAPGGSVLEGAQELRVTSFSRSFVEGKASQALHLDGDGRVALPVAATATSASTWALWVNVDAPPANASRKSVRAFQVIYGEARVPGFVKCNALI